MHSALYSLTEDVRRHEALTRRAEEYLVGVRRDGPKDELLVLFLREISRKSRARAEGAGGLLAHRLAEQQDWKKWR